ncbi:hypothetical protein YC2023_046465 [Brassica napus]
MPRGTYPPNYPIRLKAVTGKIYKLFCNTIGHTSAFSNIKVLLSSGQKATFLDV